METGCHKVLQKGNFFNIKNVLYGRMNFVVIITELVVMFSRLCPIITGNYNVTKTDLLYIYLPSLESFLKQKGSGK